jgi:hypothetical protein
MVYGAGSNLNGGFVLHDGPGISGIILLSRF